MFRHRSSLARAIEALQMLEVLAQRARQSMLDLCWIDELAPAEVAELKVEGMPVPSTPLGALPRPALLAQTTRRLRCQHGGKMDYG